MDLGIEAMSYYGFSKKQIFLLISHNLSSFLFLVHANLIVYLIDT